MDKKQLEWLHDLTHIGYEHQTVIAASHAETIDLYYEQGLTPEEAFEKYQDFLRTCSFSKDSGVAYNPNNN